MAEDAELERARQALERAELVYSGLEVDRALADLAEALTAELADSHPLIISVLLGGLIPTARLIQHLRFPYQLDYLHATRYRGDVRGHELQWVAEPRTPLAGRTVLLVDDILDEGETLAQVIRWCQAQGAARVVSAVLLVKRHDRRRADVRADYAALEVDDRYVFGSGMDYREHHRGLPGIYALPPGED